jgi:outer membrane protein TolC
MGVSGFQEIRRTASPELRIIPEYANMPNEQRKASLFLIFMLVLTCGVSQAQPVSNPDSVLETILSSLKGTPLPLARAVGHALTNATSVRKAEAAYLGAKGSVRREAGAFDPEVFFTLNHLDQQLPTASFFAGSPVLATQQTTSRSGLRMRLPIGTELELALNTTRLGTNSTFAFLNPEYDAFGSLNFRQPLLGGFSASARKQLTKSELELDAEKARYDQQVLGVGADVERMYWDLYAAERDYAVQRLTRDRAEAFLKETEVRSRAGLVGPNQIANAKTFLAEQELLLIEREEQIDRQSDLLASLIGVRPEEGKSRFIPTDEPPADYPADSVDALVARALRNNLDLQAAQRNVDAARVMADAAGWEAFPNVSLVGSLGGNGLGGGNQAVIFGTDTLRISGGGSFGDAISQVTRRRFPTWNLGIEVSLPIGLRGGLGEKERLEAQSLSALQISVEQSRALEEQVRTAYREVSHGQSRIAAARAGVDAAQEQVRIGLIEFRNGRLTAFELVRLGEDFAVAQQRYSGALVRTAKAAATLRQLTSGGYPSTPHDER